MNNTKKPIFNADAAEEYFSDLLAYYRNVANDIFRRDNDGRNASGQIYSAEYQKFLGMQAAMREVLEYFGKFDLCESDVGLPCDRLQELVEADKDGRCAILPPKEFFERLGDEVYILEDDAVFEAFLGFVGYTHDGEECIDTVYDIGGEYEEQFLFKFSDVGKKVFSSKAEAEAALKRIQEAQS